LIVSCKHDSDSSDKSKHTQINSAEDSVSNSFNSRVMWKWIKFKSLTDDIFFHDESILSTITSILKHMNANNSRNSITKTDVMIAITSFSFINDLSNQLKKSESDKDNDEKN